VVTPSAPVFCDKHLAHKNANGVIDYITHYQDDVAKYKTVIMLDANGEYEGHYEEML